MVPLLLPLFVLIAGILSGPFLDPHFVWLCFPLALLLGIAKRRLLLITVFLIGVARRDAIPPVPPDPGPEAVRLIGTVERAPEWRGIGITLDLTIVSVDRHPCPGRARLTEFLDNPDLLELFNRLDLGRGDSVEVLVALRRPTVYRDPGVFDYRRYLERQGIYWTGTIRNPRLITVMARGWHGPDRARRWIANRISRHFENDNERGLVMGMVLGRTSGLSADTERQFQAGGLFHLVVVSGFNIAVVASAVLWLTRLLLRSRMIRLLTVAVFVFIYTVLVGWQIPAVRAAIMAVTFIAGRILDRGHSPLNSTAFTAFVLLLIDPTSIEDSSFQMTFAAVTAVIGLGLPANQWAFGHWNPRLNQFDNVDRDGTLAVDVAAWRVERRMWCERYRLPYAVVLLPWRFGQLLGGAIITTLGVETVFIFFMVESFHRIAPISPLLNVPAGLIAAVMTPLGLLLIPLPHLAAVPVAILIRTLVRLLLWILQLGLTLPHATMRVPSAPVWLWSIYAVAAAVIVTAVWKKLAWLLITGSLTAAISLGMVAFGDFSPPPPRDVVVTFLDVGQGDCILLEFPDHRRMLIDGGGVAAGRFLGLREESTFSIGEDVVSAYLFSRGIRRLDTVVLTHAHNDHLDGLFDVVSNFQVGEAWLGRNPMIPAYRAFLDLLRERRIPVRWVSTGDRIGEFSVLHPPLNYSNRKSAQNNDSVVLLLDTGNQTALFTGDLEISIPAPAFVNLLKVPHHGSGGTKLKVRSNIRVISVGANNPFGHPAASALPALRTDRYGAIQVTLSGRMPAVQALR
jgi:competence protein ComEC